MKHLTDQAAVVSRSKLQEAQQLALENLKARDDRRQTTEATDRRQRQKTGKHISLLKGLKEGPYQGLLKGPVCKAKAPGKSCRWGKRNVTRLCDSPTFGISTFSITVSNKALLLCSKWLYNCVQQDGILRSVQLISWK